MQLGPTLLGSYAPLPDGYDDAVVDERFRDHWDHVGPALEALGVDELRRRQVDISRLLEADGASYRVASSGDSQDWELDVVPLLISSAEWATIEQGVIQRAVLLDLVLRDIYGGQKLLRRGIVPPELVFEHPGFMRACSGVSLHDGSQLFTYAVDLGRDNAGAYRVLADHAQSPSGSGYALANRVTLSRVFPSLYRDAQVHHVAPYFRTLRAGLQALAAHRSDDPRIVVLSPGVHSETAFEHAYLASYLGFSLVEGADLVVRNGSVFLRALGRLEPVDVILRRVDADYCDPLELRPESQLGIPGLVEACRRGTVTVVNTLGSGAIENPALNAFLPAAAKALLGQELRLAGVPTWWCGHPDDLAYVLDHLDEVVCKPIARGESSRSRFGATMSAAELDVLRAEIVAAPRRWVAQGQLSLSTGPTLTADGIKPRRSILRSYAVAREGSYSVMAGGLTRVAPDETTMRISNQAGAIAKDTWVLASEPEPQAELWLRSNPAPPSDIAGTLSERAAENLFWVGRYAERAESMVRLLRAVHDRRNAQTTIDYGEQRAVDTLLSVLSVASYTTPGFLDPAQRVDPDAELFSLTSDAQRAGSLAYSVTRLLSAADAVRDQLSIDTWQVTSTLHKQLQVLSTTPPNRQDVVQGTLGVIMQSLLALHGLAAESMVRDAGWHFMEAGRRIERFQHLGLLLSAGLDTEYDDRTDGLILESVLIAAESIITYRRRYRYQAQVATLLDLLVADATNPRSMRYQIDRLGESVQHLSANRNSATLSTTERQVLDMATDIRNADSEALASVVDRTAVDSGEGQRTELVGFLNDLVARVTLLGADIAERNFSHQPPQQPLAAAGGGG
jgi:uncharacterized circularly permuted ATP-grasp superfamily protein/uncharacterized alpha-E superfamily protein